MPYRAYAPRIGTIHLRCRRRRLNSYEQNLKYPKFASFRGVFAILGADIFSLYANNLPALRLFLKLSRQRSFFKYNQKCGNDTMVAMKF